MKKYLIIAVTVAIISFVGMVNVSATSVNSQSRDVTVGEVDKIDGDDEINDEAEAEEQGTYAPNTGLFGAGVDGAAIITTFFVIPVAVVLALLFRRTHRGAQDKNN